MEHWVGIWGWLDARLLQKIDRILATLAIGMQMLLIWCLISNAA